MKNKNIEGIISGGEITPEDKDRIIQRLERYNLFFHRHRQIQRAVIKLHQRCSMNIKELKRKLHNKNNPLEIIQTIVQETGMKFIPEDFKTTKKRFYTKYQFIFVAEDETKLLLVESFRFLKMFSYNCVSELC